MKIIPTILSLLSLTACGGSHANEIKNIGSNTMLEVATAWQEAYHAVHPEVNVSVSGGGSGQGIAGLISGDCDIANCSRAMKDKEIADAKAHGHNPIVHKVGYDGIAIYVHKDNPMPSITLEQLKEVFGTGGKITKWSQLGVDLGSPANDPILVISRQSSSGTYEYFRETVLGGDQVSFRAEAQNLNSSKDVVDSCAKTKSAIGYSGLAYATGQVRMVPVVGKTGQPVAPSIDSVLDSSYPISRPLFMYTIGEPTGRTKDYLDWILSDDGQRVLQARGYPPLRKL